MMKVLLPSDGSQDSMEAARFVAELAAVNELDIHVVTVSEPHPGFSDSVSQHWMSEWASKENKRVDRLHGELMTVLSGVCSNVSMSRRHGPIVDSLLDEIDETQADLIVVGARGHSMIRRVLLGSTSESLATYADCSVVIVRRREEPQQDNATTRPMRRIMVAYDQSKGSRESVDEVLKYRWPDPIEFNVVSVAEWPFPFEESESEDPADGESKELQHVRCAAERLATRIAGTAPNTTTQVLQARHAGEAIVSEADREQVDLVVVGDSGHRLEAAQSDFKQPQDSEKVAAITQGRPMLGSTTRYLMRHSHCSVWISRGRQ
ncbi:universal stress protein [Roseiconus nitratireducens]|nr:universal stress protein [Roseiconus nitratireducens]